MTTSTCIICYDSLHTPAVLYPCTHSVFHYSCILSWISAPSTSLSDRPHSIHIDKTCPLCRRVPLLIRRGRRRFAVPSDTSYALLLGEARAQLLRRGRRLWGGKSITATAWMLALLRGLQERHEVLAGEIAAMGELPARLAEAHDGMLAAVVGLHTRACEPMGGLAEVLKALRRVRCQAGVLDDVWEDARWDEDCQPIVRWRLEVVKKLVPGSW